MRINGTNKNATFVFLSSILWLWLVQITVRVTQAETTETTKTPSEQQEKSKCGLYLAPSTIPGAGLGLFVTEEKHVGDYVGIGDVAIPLVDVILHRGREDFFNMFSSYTWSGTFFGMGQESDYADDILAHAPGLNSAINCHMALTNVGREFPIHEHQYNSTTGTTTTTATTTSITRYNSPNAGAMTPYYNGTTQVEAYIPAGGELFKFYGERYFESRPDEYGTLPLPNDYTEAQSVCKAWHTQILTHHRPYVKDVLWRLLRAMVKLRDVRFYNALPLTPDLARMCATDGIRSLHQPTAIRSLHELQQYGRCQDGIRHGRSSIAGAGRGAFATRSFRQHDIVTGTPVLHIPKRDYTYMYDVKWVKGVGWKRRFDRRIGTQLLINYCWAAHVDSTILLCPYGTGVNFINHAPSGDKHTNSTTTTTTQHYSAVKQTRTANVKVQWAPHGIMSHNDSWLEHGHKNMYQYSVNLAMDFVAVRDIDKGDEILVDYGDAWEQAWQQHVDEWEEQNDDDGGHSYAPAATWNVEMVALP